jgi:crotonobetainyl-CoA:carnitine CoA-transferase CaiB-like acyl-CoA transferase
MPGPLAGQRVQTADWAAAHVAGELLAELGADVHPGDRATLTRGADEVDAAEMSAGEDWAVSGAMWLTGQAEGPMLHVTGAAATLARGAALAIELLSTRRGRRVSLDGAALLGERAFFTGRSRAGRASVGGATRLLAAVDGQLALTLSRPEDVELVPALVAGLATPTPWDAVSRWAARETLAGAVERLSLIGLPFGAYCPPRAPVTVPWVLHDLGPAAPTPAQPLVVNLGSLWAAPLCAHLLGLAGADVVHVESPRRPDGARSGTPAFYELLHAGHELIVLDFADRSALRALVGSADVVVTGSRVAALERLGIGPDQFDIPRVWARISAHGPDSDRVGFGDDAAVAGGLVARDDVNVLFAGDAIADPTAGVLSALAVLACLESGQRWTVDVSLAGAARCAVALGPTEGDVHALPPHPARREITT